VPPNRGPKYLLFSIIREGNRKDDVSANIGRHVQRIRKGACSTKDLSLTEEGRDVSFRWARKGLLEERSKTV